MKYLAFTIIFCLSIFQAQAQTEMEKGMEDMKEQMEEFRHQMEYALKEMQSQMDGLMEGAESGTIIIEGDTIIIGDLGENLEKLKFFGDVFQMSPEDLEGSMLQEGSPFGQLFDLLGGMQRKLEGSGELEEGRNREKDSSDDSDEEKPTRKKKRKTYSL